MGVQLQQMTEHVKKQNKTGKGDEELLILHASSVLYLSSSYKTCTTRSSPFDFSVYIDL